MSSFKDTNIVNPGTSIKYGADDMELYARLYNGVTTGIPPVTIKSTNKFGFWDGIAFFRNQADTKNMTIRGPVVMTSDRDLALPSITANDTLAAIGITNVFSVKQQLEAGTLLKQTSTPPNPASTYHHLYVNGAGQLVKRDSTGAEVLYTSGFGQGEKSPLLDYDSRVYYLSGTYYAYKYDGTLISSATTFETVAQAALDLKGTVLFAGPDPLLCSAGFTGLDIKDDTRLVIEKNCTVKVPNGYTGHCIRALDVNHWVIDCYGALDEQGTPVRNWTGFFLDSTAAAAQDLEYNELNYARVWNASTAIRLRATGPNGRIGDTTFKECIAFSCRKGILWETSAGGDMDANSFIRCSINGTAGITTNGFKDVTGDSQQFLFCEFNHNDGTMVEMNILNTANETQIIGGDFAAVGTTFTDASTSTMYFTGTQGLNLNSGDLRVKSPAGDFYTSIVNSAITGTNKTLTLPLITGTNATLPVLEQTNVFTDLLTVKRSATNELLSLYRNANAVGTKGYLIFDANDSLGNQNTYARIAGEIYDNTNNSEDGILRLYVQIAGTLANCLTIDQTGALLFGGPNTRIKIAETNLTAVRTYTLPDADGELSISGTGFTSPPFTIQGGATTDYLYLYRQTGLNNDLIDFNFDMNNSVAARKTYCDLRTTIADNTSGSEDGRFTIQLMRAGTKIEQFRLDDGRIYVKKPSNTVSDDVSLWFHLQDSLGNDTAYAGILGEINGNTDGAETGRLEFHVMDTGAEREVGSFDQSGRLEILGKSTQGELLYLRRDTSTVNDTCGLLFRMEDSLGNTTSYAKVIGKIIDNTDGSEDGALLLEAYLAGASTTVLTLDPSINQAIFGNNQRCKFDFSNLTAARTYTFPNALSSIVGAIMTNSAITSFQSSTAENTLFSYQVNGNAVDTDTHLVIKLHGYMYQNQATGTTFTIRIKVGGVTVYQDDLGGTVGQSSVDKPWQAELRFLRANQASDTATLHGKFMAGDTSTPTTGQGSITDDETGVNANIRAPGIAWTFANNTTISMTCQMSVNSASVKIQLDGYTICLER